MKLLIISAPFASGRRISAISYAEQLGMKYEVVEGINGDTLDVEAIPVAGAGISFSGRILACYLSHIKALVLRAAHKDEPCIIVEDDWKPIGDIVAAVAKIPKDSNYTILHDLNPNDAPGVMRYEGDGWQLMNPPPIVAIAYMPSIQFVHAALSYAFPIRDHVDHFYRNLCIQHRMICFRTNPGVVTGAGFASTLGH